MSLKLFILNKYMAKIIYQKQYQIYALCDPITGEVRYIGKTINQLHKRLSGHWRDKRKNYKTHWINSLKEQGLKPTIKLIEICEESNWEDRERYWIAFYRSINDRLTNWLEGGNGLPKGYKHSKETIEKIREAGKKPNKGHFKKGETQYPEKSEKCKKRILQYSLQGNFIKLWIGIVDVEKCTGINKNSITGCLKGRLNTAGGFQWRYFTENYPQEIEEFTPVKSKSGVTGIYYTESKKVWEIYYVRPGVRNWVGQCKDLDQAIIKLKNYENNNIV